MPFDAKWLAVIVVLVVAVPYVLGPLLILSSFKLKSPTRIVLLDPQGLKLPRDVKQYLQPVCAQLGELGFEPVAYFCLPDLVPNAKSISVLLQNDDTADAAMTNCIYSDVVGTRTIMKTKYVEFVSRFRDGVVLQTNNSRELSAFRDEPECHTVKFWAAQDEAELYRRHLEIGKLLSRAPRTLRHVEEFRGDIKEYLQAAVIDEAADYQVEIGLLRRVADGYRPTVKGAFLLTWQELWPWKAIRRTAKRREAQRWLAEIGTDDAE